MFRKILLLSLFSFCLSFQSARAGHILGGEIYWECLGGGDYIFHLVMYTDCSMVFPTVAPSITGPFGAISTTWQQPGGVANSSSFNCGGACYDEVYHSASDTVSLMGIPPAAGWEFFYTTCCRAYEANVTGNSAIYISSTMYPYTPNGAHMPLSADTCYNSLAHFTNLNPPVTCSGPYSFNPALFDREGDSVAIEFASPRSSYNTNVPYAPGYSAQLPFPDSTENPSNGPISLNPYTGQFSTEFYDANPGYYFTAFKIKEYRQSQLIGEYTRERPLYVLDSAACVPTATNTRPNLNLSSNNNLSLQQNGPLYTVDLQDGDSLDVNILISDFDFNSSGTPQTICLRGTSILLNSSNMTLDTGCVGPNCAKVLPQTGGFCNTISGSYRLTWVPDCSLLSFSSFSSMQIPLVFEVKDDACPIAKARQVTLLVRLHPNIQVAPQLNLVSADTAGRVHLSWTKAQMAVNAPFEAYRIYARPINGSFSLIDSISDIDSTQALYTGLPFPCELSITASGGSCPAPSPQSNFINTNVALGLADYQQIELDFDISPNPAKEWLNIQLQNPLNDRYRLEARLYDVQGRLLRIYDLPSGMSSWTLKLEQSPGIYILELSGASYSESRKLIIE